MTNIFGIKFAPLHTPLKRRLQTAAICLAASEFLLFGVFSTLFLIGAMFSPYYWASLAYITWMIIDKSFREKGGHLRMWYRRLPIWQYCAEYFPITLHKTTDLDPNENYIFGFHPHGILATGSFFNFATEATGFSKLFPGITSRLVLININFWMPFHRDHMMLCGMCSSSKESIEWIISKNGKGNAVVIVVGGAEEALDAVPHKMELTVKKRKGFVKLALRHGVSLVPVISFGENELYSQIKVSDESLITRIQHILKKTLGYTIPLFNGRGLLQYSFGYLPYRKPINTIVGKPIKVPRILNPSQEDVDKYHLLYAESLCYLFYSNRKKFAENAEIEIILK